MSSHCNQFQNTSFKSGGKEEVRGGVGAEGGCLNTEIRVHEVREWGNCKNC